MEPALDPVDPECHPLAWNALLQLEPPPNSPVAALRAELLSSFFSSEEATTLCNEGRDIAQTARNGIFLLPESPQSFRDVCVVLESLLGDDGLIWAQVQDIVISWLIPDDTATYTTQQSVLTQCYIQPILQRSPNLRLLILPFGLVVRPASGIEVAQNLTPKVLETLNEVMRHLYGQAHAVAVESFRRILNSGADARFGAVAGPGRFIESLLTSPDFPSATPIAVYVWKEELDPELLDLLVRLDERKQLYTLHIPLTGESLGSWTFTNLEELGITVELGNGISTLERFAFLKRTVPNCPNLRTLRITRIAGSEMSHLEKINLPLAASVAPIFDSLLVMYTSDGEAGTLCEVYVDRHCAWRRVDGENYGLPPTVTSSTAASR
ncbi:hypothetical protein EXIGLDRAFT_834746 [Exidia glandulosa HHB12029]|uniref:Uncharacterized protein n=1 Tax=Exidia glandulosa HHB12029 TaxID=1314781 RepID=A0A165JFR2_EXIGL|nr:hypothetical protein EXIGLDRAFT_834746 [Exidia glandulosa HHB12029]